MTPLQFEAAHAAAWNELEAALGTPPKGRRASAADRARIATLYRAACEHLALAEARAYPVWLIERLEALTAHGHQRIYRETDFGLDKLRRLFVVDFPASVRAHWRYVLVAVVVFAGPLVLTGIAAYLDPGFVLSLHDASSVDEYERMYGDADQRGDAVALHCARGDDGNGDFGELVGARFGEPRHATRPRHDRRLRRGRQWHRGSARGRRRRRCWSRPRALGVDDERSRGEIAEALEVVSPEHRERTERVERRQEVGSAQQVARQRSRRRHRQPAVHDDGESDHPLAGSCSAGTELEDDRVEPLEQKEHHEQESVAEPAELREQDHRDEEDDEADAEVDEVRVEARHDSRRTQRERDALGRLGRVAGVEAARGFRRGRHRSGGARLRP